MTAQRTRKIRHCIATRNKIRNKDSKQTRFAVRNEMHIKVFNETMTM